MRNFRRRGLALAGALAVGVAGAAVAHQTTFQSTVTGDSRPGPTQRTVTFFGDVKSPKEKCIKGRTVELFDLRTVATKLGETKSDADGNWEITTLTGRVRGTQYAQVLKKRLVNRDGHRHTCKFDKTRID
jgi:hypothetical protein